MEQVYYFENCQVNVSKTWTHGQLNSNIMRWGRGDEGIYQDAYPSSVRVFKFISRFPHFVKRNRINAVARNYGSLQEPWPWQSEITFSVDNLVAEQNIWPAVARVICHMFAINELGIFVPRVRELFHRATLSPPVKKIWIIPWLVHWLDSVVVCFYFSARSFKDTVTFISQAYISSQTRK